MRSLLVVLVIVCSGCSLLRSRYAMNDDLYAERYQQGAERGDLLGKAKQALDARHTGGLTGLYVSGGAQVRPDADSAMGGADVGGEIYASSWLTGRGALSAFVGDEDIFGGLDLGVRLQAPTRIAPFVGIGTFHGYSRDRIRAEGDGIDNDDDFFIDEPGEEKSIVDGWLSSIYPEVGAHFWVNGNWRLTTYGRYLVTTAGREHDDWLLGAQVSLFGR